MYLYKNFIKIITFVYAIAATKEFIFVLENKILF